MGNAGSIYIINGRFPNCAESKARSQLTQEFSLRDQNEEGRDLPSAVQADIVLALGDRVWTQGLKGLRV